MQSDYYINLHFNQAVAQRTGYAFKIGDKGCTFHLHCEDLDPSGMFPHIVFNHPNNTCVEGVPTGSGRDYAYTIAGNEFGVCGKTVVDLKFYDNNNDATQRISTASFMIEIIPDTYTDFEESSSSYADSLERAREEIDAAILDLQGAEHDLEEAEGDLDNMSGQFADTLQDYIDAFGNTAPINPRGAYVAATEYHPRDAVEYTAGGKTLTYINRETCTGIAPTDPDYGAHYWQIMIDVSVGGSFSALSDVSVDPQTLADGQVPVYDATGQVWENKTILENSLTSTATDKALTAAQGKELQDNKQGKELETAITIAGTQETTVETALGGLNDYGDALAENVEAIVNVYGAKNLLDEDDCFSLDNMSKSDHTFTSNNTDTRSYFDFNIDVWDGTTFIQGLVSEIISSTGHYEYSVNIPNNANRLRVLHNGSQRNLGIMFNTSVTGTCIISLDVTGVDPTTVGGLSFGNIMIRDDRITDPTYEPYAKTNQQLTADKAERADLATLNLTGSTNSTGSTINEGTYFYLNGSYCKAKTAIANGATFTLNTNFEVATVGGEISSINDNLVNVTNCFDFTSAGDSTKLPNQYHAGISLNYVSPSETGFPSMYGLVVTFRTPSRTAQLFFPEDSLTVSVRTADGNIWNPWGTLN